MKIKRGKVGKPSKVKDSSDRFDAPKENSHRVDLTADAQSQESSQVLDLPKYPPNEKALAILREMKKLQEDQPFSDSSKTQDYVREARAGGMYGEEIRFDDVDD